MNFLMLKSNNENVKFFLPSQIWLQYTNFLMIQFGGNFFEWISVSELYD